MCGLHVEQDRMWLCKNRMPGLSSFSLHSTMQDKFTPREPFVGCTAQAICSLLGERQLTLHLSPPAAGYNSTHFEPLNRGADGGSGIRIPHHNESAGKQKTNASGPLRKESKVWHSLMRTQDECFAIIKNMVAFFPLLYIFPSGNPSTIVSSFLLLWESSTHFMSSSLYFILPSLHNSTQPKQMNNKKTLSAFLFFSYFTLGLVL